MSARGSLLGNLARWTVRRLARLYYPRIEIGDAARIPRDGPVLFAANHPNSMLDPVVVGVTAGRPVRYLAKAPLFDVPVLGALLRALGMIPAYRAQDAADVTKNAGSLDAGADLLAQGEALGIFPEGLTHDAPQVAMVRSGAARIAMRALEKGARNLKIVPLGINYQDKERFRSAVWVRVGEPIDAAEWLLRHENDGRKAMRALTRELERQLKNLTVHLDHAAWAPLLPDLEALVPPSKEVAAHPAAPLLLRKRIAGAINYFMAADLGRAEEAIDEIAAFRERVGAAGLRIDSPALRYRGAALFFRLLWTPILLLAGLLPALLGFVHHFVPFSVVRLLAPKLQTPGRTTVSLARLGLGLPIYAAWYAAVVWFWLAQTAFRPWAVWTWTALMPFAGLAALAYLAHAGEALALWWHQVKLALQPARARELLEAQAALKLRLATLAAEYARAFPVEPLPPAPPLWPRRVRGVMAWGATAAVLLAIFFAARSGLRAKPLPELTGEAPSLALLSEQELKARLAGDENALRDVLAGLDELERRALELRAEFESGKRSYYRQEDNDAVRAELLAYLNYRKALLRLVWRNRSGDDLELSHPRLRAFLIASTAATALYDTSLKFVTRFAREESVKKLNEGAPEWGIPERLYDTIRANLSQLDNRKLLLEALERYDGARPAFEAEGLAAGEPHAGFHERIARGRETIAELGENVWKEKAGMVLGDVTGLGKGAAYRVQSLVATWIGDTKLREPREGRALIDRENLDKLRARLEPGDILLERRNWYLSNAFLPGYWPHGALYVGTPQDLRELGLDADPRVKPHWKTFAGADEAGHPHAIVEALSEGVVCASLEHSCGGGDAVCVLRPRLSLDEKKEAIARAFSHLDKPYDFEFDFFSTDKIVCTELVFRAYDGPLEFPLVDVMGRKTLPAVEIVRKFAQERGDPGRQLDFICFLDGDERTGTCFFDTEDALIGTLDRPGMTWLLVLEQGVKGR
ncbi:MAG: 1-acyl-sn-glycerol-3-phosphate acyltransferase [Planctomycetota bacterium]|nr:1-acyl-sn-glycerol-3-phosphate acyltransferase [Planctomycetota bacterium]